MVSTSRWTDVENTFTMGKLVQVLDSLVEGGKVSKAEREKILSLVRELVNNAYNEGWREGYRQGAKDFNKTPSYPDPWWWKPYWVIQ